MNDLTKNQRFHATVLPYLNSAINLARWLSHGHQDAEDIVQEAYLRAFNYFDSFHGEDGRVWLLGIVRNTFYTWYQLHKIHSKNEQFEEDLHSDHSGITASQEGSNPVNILIQKDSHRSLMNALRDLPIEFREVMVMRELEDLSYKQIAEIIQVPIGTVMSRLGRGRKQLASILAAKQNIGGSQ